MRRSNPTKKQIAKVLRYLQTHGMFIYGAVFDFKKRQFEPGLTDITTTARVIRYAKAMEQIGGAK